MTKLRHRYLALLATGAIMLTLALLAVPASANPGLRVSGAIVRADAVPGNSYTHTMTIGSREDDPPMDIAVDVMGLGQSPEGTCQALEAPEDSSPYSARSFITLDKSSFHLEPGDSQEVVATINIPGDVGAGGRYAVIYIHTQPTGGGQVGIISAINVPLYLTIKDSQLIHTGKIIGLPTTEAVSGEPVEILTMFQNTGNHDFKVKGEVTIKDAQDKILETISIPLTASAVVPGITRQLKATFIPQGELPLGSYSVQSKVMLEDGTVLDEASGSFEVKETYIPPPPAASITLTPGSAATLATEDGRISIAFPQGSVTGEVEVSIQSYSPSQLPTPQSGITLGTTCFRVDGIAGLLVKKATITVKYSSADLDKADGDASRLKLARWDEAQGKWSVLKTKVNTEAAALSTDTNQLSIWAVVVGGTSSSSPFGAINLWWLIGGAAGVVIIALLVYFLVVRRRRAYEMTRKLICGVLLAVCLVLPAVLPAPPAMAGPDSTEVSGTVPLVIYDVSSSAIGQNTATILWKTNGAASSQVFYDAQFHANIADYASHTEDSTPVIAHSVPLSGLSPATTYHYRAKSVAIVNGTEFTAISEDYTFTTLPAAHVPPSVITIAAWPVGPRSAVVWGRLTDMGGAKSVKVYFQWGETTGYGSQTGQQTMKRPGIFIAVITGLTPGTRYHFRTVAVGDGTSYGFDKSFTTSKWWW